MHDESTLYMNGIVHTMQSEQAPADAVLIRGNRIAAVGRHDDIAAPGANRVDLGGCSLIPGFNDSHAHLLSFGLTLDQLDVSADSVRSIGEIVQAVRERVSETPAGSWVHGRGYNQNELAERRHVTRHDLDEVSQGRPVVLDHTSGHVLTCNTTALHRAGISRSTDDPPGGQIDRDKHGEPTGLLKESAMALLRRVIPGPSVEAGKGAILRAMQVLSTAGITSASDAWTGQGPFIESELAMYRAALSSGDLAGRITLMPLIDHVVSEESESVRTASDFDTGSNSEWLTLGATKIFADGALSTRTAAMRQPYIDDPSNRGILFWERAALVRLMSRAHRAGWQIATHALGDRAVAMVVDCYGEVLTSDPRADHRHRIEHCMYADDELAGRMQELGIVASLQPDIYRLGDAYIAALGASRASQSIPVGLLRRRGVHFAFSSDLPVIPGRPLDVIRSAMERTTPQGVRLGHEHSVSALEAIRAYTWGGAFATHAEALKGTLAPNMLADFTILSRDPAETALEDWHELDVVKTVVGGRVTYEA